MFICSDRIEKIVKEYCRTKTLLTFTSNKNLKIETYYLYSVNKRLKQANIKRFCNLIKFLFINLN